MASSLASLKDLWATTTDHDSIRVKAVTIVTTAVLGWAITWSLIDIWTQTWGYSSLMTYITGLTVLLALYFCLSYVFTRIRDRVGT
ncbi:hypothetical protein B4589_001605 [Halolamina sp. CBA1230]|uniref:hypothetical protein n=1 Tax=Halolamina sp. CBA1230 TaxID=1853690 RepID=UPI0009A24ED1|nr:hypothetical protein [Halolamina sp. CBA1230]QKY19135.1 hypothetical protein B4589_001605 [Halolamina sp. CBA1230]